MPKLVKLKILTINGFELDEKRTCLLVFLLLNYRRKVPKDEKWVTDTIVYEETYCLLEKNFLGPFHCTVLCKNCLSTKSTDKEHFFSETFDLSKNHISWSFPKQTSSRVEYFCYKKPLCFLGSADFEAMNWKHNTSNGIGTRVFRERIPVSYTFYKMNKWVTPSLYWEFDEDCFRDFVNGKVFLRDFDDLVFQNE